MRQDSRLHAAALAASWPAGGAPPRRRRSLLSRPAARRDSMPTTAATTPSAARHLRLACFGMLDEPKLLGECLARLALAQDKGKDVGGLPRDLPPPGRGGGAVPGVLAVEPAAGGPRRAGAAAGRADPGCHPGRLAAALRALAGRKPDAQATQSPQANRPQAAADPPQPIERSAEPPAPCAPPTLATAPATAGAARPAPRSPTAPRADRRARRGKLEKARKLLGETGKVRQLRQAFELAREVADAHPESREAQQLAGEAAYRISRWSDAADYFRRGGGPGRGPARAALLPGRGPLRVGQRPGRGGAAAPRPAQSAAQSLRRRDTPRRFSDSSLAARTFPVKCTCSGGADHELIGRRPARRLLPCWCCAAGAAPRPSRSTSQVRPQEDNGVVRADPLRRSPSARRRGSTSAGRGSPTSTGCPWKWSPGGSTGRIPAKPEKRNKEVEYYVALVDAAGRVGSRSESKLTKVDERLRAQAHAQGARRGREPDRRRDHARPAAEEGGRLPVQGTDRTASTPRASAARTRSAAPAPWSGGRTRSCSSPPCAGGLVGVVVDRRRSRAVAVPPVALFRAPQS